MFNLINNGIFLHALIKEIDAQKRWININIFAKDDESSIDKKAEKEFEIWWEYMFSGVRIVEKASTKTKENIFLTKEQRLNLFRDKNHPNSKIVIEVKTEDGSHVAYIYHQLLAHLMDVGKNLFAKFIFVESYADEYSVGMEIFMRK